MSRTEGTPQGADDRGLEGHGRVGHARGGRRRHPSVLRQPLHVPRAEAELRGGPGPPLGPAGRAPLDVRRRALVASRLFWWCFPVAEGPRDGPGSRTSDGWKVAVGERHPTGR